MASGAALPRRSPVRRRATGRRRGAFSLFLAILVLTAGTSGAPPDTTATPTRRALLIAIDQYLPVPAGPRAVKLGRPPVSNLEGAGNDADAMRAVLIARYGFSARNIRVLRNREATRDRILSETRNWLVRAGTAGDMSLFFYAGHGSRVRNLKSREADQLDETLVPADANLGRPDIHDKELARLFGDALDKGISVTAVIDSCHSGSIARGISPTSVRFVPPDDSRTVAADEILEPPESRGALIFSAAQDFQLAGETRVPEEGDATHGLFSWALVKTLRTAPASESAERIFLRVRGLMQSVAPLQEPVLAGTAVRKRASLFGTEPSASSGIVIAVQSIDKQSVILQGGLAAGIRPGAELSLAEQPNRVVLRVTETQGLSLSRADVITGTAAGVQPGTLFVLTKWAAPAGQPLRVWLPDPKGTAVEPPIPIEVRALLENTGAAGGLFELRAERKDAEYVLAGRIRNGVREYAWLRPYADDPSIDLTIPSLPPAATKWTPLDSDAGTLARNLRDLVVRLSVVRNWLQLESPPDDGTFPYRLALKHATTGELRTSGSIIEGDDYGLVLTRDDPVSPKVDRRYVYVFAMNDEGKTTLLFPGSVSGTVENMLPVGSLAPKEIAREIRLPLAGRLEFSPGIDAFLMLTTSTALPDPSVLAGEGVRSATLLSARDPLSVLLAQGGVRGRDVTVVTPADWSISQFTVRTVSASDKKK